MFGITIVAFLIGIKKKKAHEELKSIFIYIRLSLLVDLFTIYLYFFSTPSFLATKLANLSYTIFLLGEYGIFLSFIIKNLSGAVRKFLSKSILILFYIVVIILPLFLNSKEQLNVVYSSLDSISLIIVSLFYFYELINHSSFIQIESIPAFWIITAIFLYASCSLPIYIFQFFIFRKMPEYYEGVFSINFLLYCVLYILFIKAYLCKKKTELA
jgi:hypothetical protein